MKKTILLSLIIFALSLLQISDTKAAENYGPGSLLSLQGVENATVYYIAGDGHKYAFPDSKTYYTWFNNFDNVIKVTIEELDQYPDGGIVTYRAGTKLVTTTDTAKIYAVSPEGMLYWIPTAEIAENLYGKNWASMVQDVIPGYFSSSYTYTEGNDLSDKYPPGTLIKNNEEIYYVDYSNTVRKFSNLTAFEANNFSSKYIVSVDDITNYELGSEIAGMQTNLAKFSPGWVCCSQP